MSNPNTNNILVEKYTDKSFVVRGDTRPYTDGLKLLGGKWNAKLSGGAGWIFSNSNIAKVVGYFNMNSIPHTNNYTSSQPIKLSPKGYTDKGACLTPTGDSPKGCLSPSIPSIQSSAHKSIIDAMKDSLEVMHLRDYIRDTTPTTMELTPSSSMSQRSSTFCDTPLYAQPNFDLGILSHTGRNNILIDLQNLKANLQYMKDYCTNAINYVDSIGMLIQMDKGMDRDMNDIKGKDPDTLEGAIDI